MKGFPKNLNTKHDYEYVRANFPPELWIPEYEMLLASRTVWMPTGEVASEDAGIVDATHKIEVEQDSENNQTRYMQYELQENPNAKIFRLGFTVSEVEDILTAAQPVPISEPEDATGYTPGL